jgi:site-specific DNA-methyltransferase (adenine-specific)
MATQTVIQGDCREVMRSMLPGSVKAIVTSPPYNLAKRYASYNDNRPLAEYLAEQCEVAGEIARVLDREGGHLFLNVGSNTRHPRRSVQVAMEYGKHLQLQQPSVCWVKSIALNGSSLPEHLHDAMHGRQVGHFVSLNGEHYLNPTGELIWHFSPTGRSKIDRLAIGVPYVWADQPERFRHGRHVHCRGSCWHIPYKTTQSRADRDFHPAPFPVELPLLCLRLAGCKPGDLIIDPFMGTGATLLAAQQLGLDAIGVDIDMSYCDAACRRLGQGGAVARLDANTPAIAG